MKWGIAWYNYVFTPQMAFGIGITWDNIDDK
jgi:hypothetical protein